MAIFVTVPPELLVALQGKFEPSATRGLLSGLPYGGGVAMIMCPWAVVKRAMAETARISLSEYISVLACALLDGVRCELRWFWRLESLM